MKVNKYDQDEKNTKFSFSNYKRGLKYIKQYKVQLLTVFIFNVISLLASLALTKILQYIIDYIIPNYNVTQLFYMICVSVICTLINILFKRMYLKILAKANQNIIQDIKNDLFTHIQYLSFHYFDTRPHGKILVRLTEYVEDVSTLITERLVKTFLNIFNMLIILIFMFSTSVILTLVTLVGIVILSVIFAITAKIKRKNKLEINNKNSNLNAYLVETLRGMQTTQAFNRQQKNQNIFTNLSKKWRNASCYHIKYGNIGWCSVQIISHTITASIYFIGAMFLYPSISLGAIVAMGNYSSSFWEPIQELFDIMDEFINSITYLERIFETMDEPIEIKDNIDSKDIEIKGKVEFNNVSFSYIEQNKVLDNISFQIKPGEKVAFVGKTGSGKTTITNLITRFYDIDNGSILIDDVNIKKIKLNSLRKQIVIMQQDNYLFSTSIMNNLKYGNEKITDDEVVSICKKLKVHDWIMHMEEGYNTKLTNNGSNLSEGEKQILCYIRTIIHNPKILILDEATSKLDAKTEKILYNLTKEMVKNKTVITIAHRLSTVVDSDKILFLKDKNISEYGTHDELLEKKGAYYNLYMSQQQMVG